MEYFSESHYLIRKKIFKLLGAAFHIYNSSMQTVAYCKMKAFKLKEDFRIFTGEDMNTEIAFIKARNIIDISATYDVFNSESGEKLGALRRKGLKSFVRDEWLILDTEDREIGRIHEDSMALALVRRFACHLVPQNFDCLIHDQNVCTFRQNFNPFVWKIGVSFLPGSEGKHDLMMAAGLLLCAIEGRQD